MMLVCLGPQSHGASLPWPTGSWKQSAVLAASYPAAEICPAARKGDLEFLAEQAQTKLLLLYGNAMMGIQSSPMHWHAVDSANMSSLEFLFNLPSCVDTLLNLPAKDGNYPLMVAVTNNRVECEVRLLAAGSAGHAP